MSARLQTLFSHDKLILYETKSKKYDQKIVICQSFWNGHCLAIQYLDKLLIMLLYKFCIQRSVKTNKQIRVLNEPLNDFWYLIDQASFRLVTPMSTTTTTIINVYKLKTFTIIQTKNQNFQKKKNVLINNSIDDEMRI